MNLTEHLLYKFFLKTDLGFKIFAPILQNLIWSDRAMREKIESIGVHVQPANFYSQLPTIEDINSGFEYKNDFEFIGDLFNESEISIELDSLIPFAQEFKPPFGETKDSTTTTFDLNNSQFTHSDCFAYYSIVRKYKPANIIEIGSGFSTQVSRLAVNQNNYGKITSIEPFPRPFLPDLCDQLIQKKIQDVSLDELTSQINDGDILFIDSTHVVKAGSDCLWIYLKLLPELIKQKKKIIVHAHDIFLPSGFPKSFLINHRISWCEQYLLHAFLLCNPAIQIIYGSHYHDLKNKSKLMEMQSGRTDIMCGGSSFWFRLLY